MGSGTAHGGQAAAGSACPPSSARGGGDGGGDGGGGAARPRLGRPRGGRCRRAPTTAGGGCGAGAARPPLPAAWRTESGRLVDPEEEEEEKEKEKEKGCGSTLWLLTERFGICPPPSRHPWGP